MNQLAKVTFTRNVFKGLATKVGWAASEDPSRAAIHDTICLDVSEEEVTAVSTNGCILAMLPLTCIEKVEIPPEVSRIRLAAQKDAYAPLSKYAGPVSLVVYENPNKKGSLADEFTIETDFEGVKIQNLAGHVFPNWRSVIPRYDSPSMFVVSESMKEAFRYLEIKLKANRINEDYIRMDFSDEEVTMYPSSRQDLAHVIPADILNCMPKEFTLRVSLKHIAPMLKAMGHDTVVCELQNNNWPVHFKAESGLQAVYMPVRVK